MALSLSLALLLRRRPFLGRGFLSAAGFGELRQWQVLSDLLTGLLCEDKLGRQNVGHMGRVQHISRKP